MLAVRTFLAVTDSRWYRFLAARPHLDEVNFWRPSAATTFRSLRTGEPFLFKTRMPENRIVGGGFFSGFAGLRISEAWDFYGEGNGTSSLPMLLGAIDSYRQDRVRPDSEIRCVHLRDVDRAR